MWNANSDLSSPLDMTHTICLGIHGPWPQNISSYISISFTERMHKSMRLLSPTTSSMLNKTRNLNQCARKKLPLPWEAYKYIHQLLHFKQPDIPVSKVTAKIHNPIMQDNLTLSVCKSNTTKYTVLASNITGFEALCCFITRVGLGVKKRNPKLTTVNTNTGNGSDTLTVQEQDTIHLVDVESCRVCYLLPASSIRFLQIWYVMLMFTQGREEPLREKPLREKLTVCISRLEHEQNTLKLMSHLAAPQQLNSYLRSRREDLQWQCGVVQNHRHSLFVLDILGAMNQYTYPCFLLYLVEKALWRPFLW